MGLLTDDQVHKLISAQGLMAQLTEGDRLRTHPLVLPMGETSQGISDYSALRVQLPLQLRRTPREPIEEMLAPLAALCETHRGMPVGWWTYRWYYLELLDRDEVLRPLCWVNAGLFAAWLWDDRPCRWPPCGMVERVGHVRCLQTMDNLGRMRVGLDEREEEILVTEWQDWLLRTWREHEEEWHDKGLVTAGPVAPWSSQLAYRPPDGDDEQQTEADAPDLGAMARQSFETDYPGLYWTMVPLYDREEMWRIWEAMKRETYITSVLNPSGPPAQGSRLWKQLKQRFPGTYSDLTRFQHDVLLREARVLELLRQGKTGREVAEILYEEGLHPLDPDRVGALRLSPEARDAHIGSGEKVVSRIRQRLVKAGLIEKGKRGRPRKR